MFEKKLLPAVGCIRCMHRTKGVHFIHMKKYCGAAEKLSEYSILLARTTSGMFEGRKPCNL